MKNKSKKGISPELIAILVAMIFSTVLISSMILEMEEQADEEVQELKQEFGEFDRSVTLHPEPSQAEQELTSLTLFTMLRAEHCLALHSYSLGTDITDPEAEIDEELAANVHPDLRPLRTLDFSQARNLECNAEATIIDLFNLADTVEEIADMEIESLTCAMAGGSGGFVAGGAAAGTAIGGAAGFAAPGVGNLVGAAAGQTIGRAVGALGGAVVSQFCESGGGFEPDSLYLADGANDMEGRFGNIGFRYEGEENNERPMVLQHDSSDIIKRGNIPGAPSSYRNADYYWDGTGLGEAYDEDDEEFDWSSEGNMYIAPNIQIMGEIYEGETDLDELRSCEDYPIANYIPYTVNMPLVVYSDQTIDSGTDLYGNNQGDDDYGCGEPDTDWDTSIQFEQVICPGAEGRIQANKGEPDFTGQSNFFQFEEEHHKIYPFIEVRPETNDCVQQKADDFASWTYIDENNVPNEVTLSCNSFSDTYNQPQEANGNEYACGVNERSIGDQTYYQLRWYRN